MELKQVGNALANDTRLRLLRLVAEKHDSAVEIHRRYIDEHDDEKHRESIYRALEILVDSQLLSKEYRDGQGLIYRLNHDRLSIDLHTTTVEPVASGDEDETSSS